MRRYTARTFLRELSLVAVAAAYAIPLYLLVVLSLKTTQGAAQSPFSFPWHPVWSNFGDAWSGGSELGGASIAKALLNSCIVTVFSLGGLVLLGSLAAYTIARRASRLSDFLYVVFLVGVTLPVQIVIIPIFRALDSLALTGTYLGIVIFYVALLLPFTVFLYATFMRSMPVEYEEASYTDGAGSLRTFLSVVFPLVRPVTGTVIVLDAIYIWNDFFAPLVLLGGTGKETLPVTIYSFVGKYVSSWALIFAAICISVAPVLLVYFALQRQLIRGFASGLKG